MVVFDQDHVVEADAVVLSAAAAHSQLVQRAQTGRGLTRVEDHGARPGHGIDEAPRQRGDARHAAQKVERGPLGGEQGARRAGDRSERIAVGYLRAFGHQRDEADARIHQAIGGRGHIQSRDHAGLLWR